ncbi:CRISPR-associated endonuclease Cas3'' [Rhodomicrobium udaipurense]|uniref:CRISPR-associated endonuclease Cas3 n=3 Tax=Rhodomicrobium udaipurense TaxID=1202716 RepID=A0A8I1KL86_9HYPH|nr:CRISPR-associated endonuclease Cas3'' [Rhodomicrobium udaipurense]MBJ7545126.1 CRISPR-associated endonuclease Cas3'' [Rhodomicrobium udaipurense]
MYFAHSSKDGGKVDWQPLAEHLSEVAALAAQLGAPWGGDRAARIAGLLHDLGKYHPDFQRRLEGSDIRVEHSIAGAALILSLTANPRERAVAELIAHAIAGHHAGLPDQIGDASSLSERLRRAQLGSLATIWRNELDVEASDLAPAFAFKSNINGPFRLSFLGRMLFSCLVDADFKNTEAYYNRIEGRTADRDWPALSDVLPALIERLDSELAQKTAVGIDTHVNHLRQQVLTHVRGKANEVPGLFTLTVPTGGGKTLTSLAFALDHARAHGMRRIIYAIPFTSVIDQTAGIFRDLFGDDIVLEHHSAIDEEKVRNLSSRDKLRLAMEDWAAPVVVTTTVQLFESLFSARPSRCRKLHNIAGSVIVLDEAQTLPRHLLLPILRVIEELAANYGCTIVLCTATQPALGARKGFPGLPLDGRELAPDPAGLARELRRTRLDFAGPMDNAALVDALGRERQALVIVNSRAHALDLYRDAVKAGLDGVLHLTTRQYAVNRREILKYVRARLENDRPCRLIATSLVEAGVDVDFPRVFRAEAGLDQIAQAAGRCNREGRRDPDASVVTVFEAVGYSVPSEIKGLIGDFSRIRDKHADLFAPAAIQDYFEEVFWRMGDRLDGKDILRQFIVDRTGTYFQYRTAGEKFRMIESGLLPVIVPGDEAARTAVADLGNAAIPSGKLARQLQGYIVQVPPKARALLMANGHVTLMAEDIRGDQFAVLQAPHLYTKETGLIWEDADYLGEENSIW